MLSRIHFAALLVSLLPTACVAVLAEEPTLRQSLVRLPPQSGVQPMAIQKVYDLYAAEPPQVQYALEVRYLPYGNQAGSDWFMFATASSEEELNDRIVWVLLHLIADYRVTTFVSEPEWEYVDTYEHRWLAQLDAFGLEQMGYLTRVEGRYPISLQPTSPALLTTDRCPKA